MYYPRRDVAEIHGIYKAFEDMTVEEVDAELKAISVKLDHDHGFNEVVDLLLDKLDDEHVLRTEPPSDQHLVCGLCYKILVVNNVPAGTDVETILRLDHLLNNTHATVRVDGTGVTGFFNDSQLVPGVRILD